MKLKGSYETVKPHKFFSNFYFTDQNIYRPELQKVLPNVNFQLVSLHIDYFLLKLAICIALNQNKGYNN